MRASLVQLDREARGLRPLLAERVTPQRRAFLAAARRRLERVDAAIAEREWERG